MLQKPAAQPNVPQEIVSEDTVSVDKQILEERTKLALKISRFLFWGAGVIFVVAVINWAFFMQDRQSFLSSLAILPIVIPSGIFPTLIHRNQTTTGMYLMLYGLFISMALIPFLSPVSMPPIVVGYIVLIALSNMLLGVQGSRWIIGTMLPAFMANLIYATSQFASPPPEGWNQGVEVTTNAIISLLAIFIAIIVLRQVVGEQETATREARLNFRKSQKLAQVEQSQRLYLQTTVQQFIEQTTAVGEGDLTAQITLDDHDQDNDLHRLGESLNRMVTSLRSIIGQIRETASEIAAAASEIQAAATQQSANAAEQNASITQTVATVEELRSTVLQTAERTSSVVGLSQQSVQTSLNGHQTISDTVDGMNLIRQRVDNIADNTLILSERTQQVSEIIESVNQIADQSKLLALNASIEAARAGEEGKGFSVVAMEVRQLAEQSRDATARVHNILNEIQQATNTVVMVTEEGSKGVESGTTLVEQVGQAIEELTHTIEIAAQAAEQIAASTQQQTNGMDQLVAAMAQIKQASSQSAASAKQTEQSVRNLMEMSRKLEETATQYRT